MFVRGKGAGMKKYPNINKYFNRTPRGYLISLMILHILIGGWIFVWLLTIPGGWIIKLLYLAYLVVIAYVIYHFYRNVATLANARLGKHLTKYYGLEGDALVAQLDAIEAEVGNPIYADVSNRRKYNAFFITENWLVGTDGVNLLRVNVCKREDIVSVDTGYMATVGHGRTYYYILLVLDKNNYTYKFWLRSPENVEKAYEKLSNIQEF